MSAKERARQMYPDLGVKDSLFYRTFLELVADAKKTDPDQLTVIDWPIHFAHRAGQMLGVRQVTPIPTYVPSTPVVNATPPLGSSLDRKPRR